jgi:hypothetical protein
MKKMVFLLGIFGFLWANRLFPLEYKTTVQFMGKSSVYYSQNPRVEILIYDSNDTSPVVRVNRQVIEGLSPAGGGEPQKVQFYIKKLKNGKIFIVEIAHQGNATQEEVKQMGERICQHYKNIGEEIDLVYINPTLKKGFYLQIEKCGEGGSPTPSTSSQ